MGGQQLRVHLSSIALIIYFSFLFKKAFSTNCGDLCLVRVGRKSHIHQSVMEFSLDSMTKQVLEKASHSTTEEELNKIKEKLKNIHNDEKKLEHEIWKLKSSLPLNQYEVFPFTFVLVV